MIIDAHHHLLNTPGYLETLVAECRRLEIAKVCLFGGGRFSADFGLAGDEQVLAAGQAYPDLIMPFACFDLGVQSPERINAIGAQGFKGVKFINPTRDYDDKGFYPVYERLQALGLPAIFHTGIVARSAKDHSHDINNRRHQPICLDTIARAFPNLNLIGAHLGNPWYEEAAMALRWNPNLYADLSGSTMKCKPPEFLGGLLWWTPATRYRDPLGRHAWEKIVFGSDVPAAEIEDVLNDYKRTMAALNLAQELQCKVLHGTMARILGLTGCSGDEQGAVAKTTRRGGR